MCALTPTHMLTSKAIAFRNEKNKHQKGDGKNDQKAACMYRNKRNQNRNHINMKSTFFFTSLFTSWSLDTNRNEEQKIVHIVQPVRAPTKPSETIKGMIFLNMHIFFIIFIHHSECVLLFQFVQVASYLFCRSFSVLIVFKMSLSVDGDLIKIIYPNKRDPHSK